MVRLHTLIGARDLQLIARLLGAGPLPRGGKKTRPLGITPYRNTRSLGMKYRKRPSRSLPRPNGAGPHGPTPV
jgi:hypothetical protein